MVFKRLMIFLEMIKVEHTVFALPFAYTGAILVYKRIPSVHDLIWITMAMAGARTAAMSLNRLIDRHIDARNPRTSGRALPRSLLSIQEVLFYAVISFAILLVSAYNLSPMALKLSPIAVLVLVFYSYTKRFTWSCHLFLGMALGLAPLGAWIAIANSFNLAPIILGAGVMFWVAGFDIIYACEDYDFDRSNGIYSIPACYDIKKGLQISAFFHVLAVIIFISSGLILKMGLFYYLGMAVAAILLFYQHYLLKPDDLSRPAAFSSLKTLSTLMLLTLAR